MKKPETSSSRGISHPRPSRSRVASLNVETMRLLERAAAIEMSVERLLASLPVRSRPGTPKTAVVQR